MATPSPDWNPEQYGLFQAERAQPFCDLLTLVRPQPDMRVVDLGCGTGELTRELYRRLAAAETTGIDNSPAMLTRAAAFSERGLHFRQGDIAGFPGAETYDLIFSNAALQWVPPHEALLRRLAGALTARGQLAVQVPANHDHISHVVATEIAAEQPFRDALGGYRRVSPVLAPENYATLLHELGFREQHVRLQVYGHELESREAVVEWVKGTLLTDYERRLPNALWPRFLAHYRERLLPQLADEQPFFYPFKRILFWAVR